jgi:hypothetical protein
LIAIWRSLRRASKTFAWFSIGDFFGGRVRCALALRFGFGLKSIGLLLGFGNDLRGAFVG